MLLTQQSARLRSDSASDLYTRLALKVRVRVCVFYFPSMCRRSLGLFSFRAAPAARRDLHADAFCCCSGLECASLQVLKITKQREAAARKLWMRSWAANTARSDMKGAFVLDSPSVVSYLCSVVLVLFFGFFFPFQNLVSLVHNSNCHRGPSKIARLGKHLSLSAAKCSVHLQNDESGRGRGRCGRTGVNQRDREKTEARLRRVRLSSGVAAALMPGSTPALGKHARP